jgi:hypothetical protein
MGEKLEGGRRGQLFIGERVRVGASENPFLIMKILYKYKFIGI